MTDRISPRIQAYDASRRAILSARGKDVLDLLQRVSTNDLSKLGIGSGIPTILLNEKGRIVEVMTVLRRSVDTFLLVGESENAEALLGWLNRLVFLEEAKFEVTTSSFTHLLLYRLHQNDAQPLSQDVVDNLLSTHELAFLYECIMFEDFTRASHLKHVLIPSAVPRASLARMFSMLQVADDRQFDSDRMALGIPVAVSELTLDFNPLEAGLEHLVVDSKGCYTGQEVIARIGTYKKLSWKRVNLSCTKHIATLPAIILSGEQQAGMMTSSASLKAGEAFPAMGYLRKEFWGSPSTFTLAADSEASIRLTPTTVDWAP